MDYDGRDIIIVTTSKNFRFAKETLLKTASGKAPWNKYATSKTNDIYITIGQLKNSSRMQQLILDLPMTRKIQHIGHCK
jgi:hypothetical protein